MTETTSILGPENLIEIIRGSTKTFELEVHDENNEYVDLTGGRVIFTVKCDIGDTAPKIQKDSLAGATQVDITVPKEGKAEIKLVPSDTQTLNLGEYVFDVWVVLASGSRNPVVGPAPFMVLPGVTVLT
jgi:hypothetical protein